MIQNFQFWWLQVKWYVSSDGSAMQSHNWTMDGNGEDYGLKSILAFT